MRFDSYDRAEASTIGAAFAAALRGHAPRLNAAGIPTAHWTEKIIDWWCACASDRAVVDAHPPSPRIADDDIDAGLRIAPRYERRFGESMVDLAHHAFLSYDHYADADYWHRAYEPSAAPEMLLALESEAGKLKNRGANRRMIFEDASKLVALAARVKVVVFASHDAAERRRVHEVADRMIRHDYTRTRAGAEPTWLWIDLPWCIWGEFGPECHVGVAGRGLERSTR
jgi:hypothetical protein